MKLLWQDTTERVILLKHCLATVAVFLGLAIVQFTLIVKSFQPANIVLPIVVGSIVGYLLGYNAVLRQRLVKSNNTKTMFLARMNHELRTPMNAILGFAELLEDEPNLTSDQRNEVHRIVGASKHLLNLINELLEFASIETGKVKLHSEPVDVPLIMHESLEIIEPLASHKGIVIKHHFERNESTPVVADELRLRQILINILTNAVKYNKDNGQININYTVGKDKLRVTIEDTGNGISESNLARLFEPFNRLGAEKSAIEGTGIGLSITKTLVEMMSGDICCNSVEGKGSRFIVELPRDLESNTEFVVDHS